MLGAGLPSGISYLHLQGLQEIPSFHGSSSRRLNMCWSRSSMTHLCVSFTQIYHHRRPQDSKESLPHSQSLKVSECSLYFLHFLSLSQYLEQSYNPMCILEHTLLTSEFYCAAQAGLELSM